MDHPYIRHLARNPLMLSAICLVNYFERGQLPKDRAILYRLCVEGLLHHWDQRREIYSTFPLQDKLRTCREVALAMQAADRAEYPADDVEAIFARVLGKPARAKQLLEHIRYRTGLLLERRPKIFAFAHLTFQEYLAAQAVHEGNRGGIDAEQLAREHADGRWREVIALYCGLASGKAARHLIERLTQQPDTTRLADVLADAYLSAGPELAQDMQLRRNVLERIALAPVPYQYTNPALARFPAEEVTPIANAMVGKTQSCLRPSEAYRWLQTHPDRVDVLPLAQRLREWRILKPRQTAELSALLHGLAPDAILATMAADPDMYVAPGPSFEYVETYSCQAEVALSQLETRQQMDLHQSPGLVGVLLQTLRALVEPGRTSPNPFSQCSGPFFRYLAETDPPQEPTTWPVLASLAHQLAKAFPDDEETIKGLRAWAESLERATAAAGGAATIADTTAKTLKKQGSRKGRGGRKK